MYILSSYTELSIYQIFIKCLLHFELLSLSTDFLLFLRGKRHRSWRPESIFHIGIMIQEGIF